MGVELNQTDGETNTSEQINGRPYVAPNVSVIKANTDGIPDRLKVEPPLWGDQIIQLGAAVSNLARVYRNGEGPNPI